MSPDTWDKYSTAWEWIAAPPHDTRTDLVNFIVRSYWMAAADRPPLENWSEVMELAGYPLRYYNPFL